MKTQVNITGTDPQIKLATSLIEKLERSIDKMKMKSEDKQNRIESKYMDKAIIAAFERASKDSGEVAATSIIHILKNQRQTAMGVNQGVWTLESRINELRN